MHSRPPDSKGYVRVQTVSIPDTLQGTITGGDRTSVRSVYIVERVLPVEEEAGRRQRGPHRMSPSISFGENHEPGRWVSRLGAQEGTPGRRRVSCGSVEVCLPLV